MPRAGHRASILTLAVLLFVTLLAPAVRADNRDVLPWPGAWTSEAGRDHPLAGQIWSRAAGGIVSAQDYGTALARSRFILLGEHHDNADHHRLQAWAIATVSKLRGARLVEGAPQADFVALEMLSEDQSEALDRFYGRNARVPRPRSAQDFGRMLKWETLGWPDYALYEPIVEAAINAYLQVVPANAAKEETRRVGREGIAALPADEARRLALDVGLDDASATDLVQEIRTSHCDMLPAQAIPNTTMVQRLRDARMADALIKAGEWKGAFLIAGNGHVRSDRGVPWYLARRGVADAQVTSVMHVEVTEDKTQLEDYLAGNSSKAADFLVFTPRQPRPDACEEMRRQMEKMRAQRKP